MSLFTDLPEDHWRAHNALAFAIRDNFPVSPGHTLVITKREIPTWFDATPEEQLAVMALVEEVKRQLDAEFKPHGYNVGFNAGAAAGQTVPHLHVHVIPRYIGDMDDPRGGVRHVIPAKGNYLVRTAPPAPHELRDAATSITPRAEPLVTGGDADPFLRHLATHFATRQERAGISWGCWCWNGMAHALGSLVRHSKSSFERWFVEDRVFRQTFDDLTYRSAVRRNILAN